MSNRLATIVSFALLAATAATAVWAWVASVRNADVQSVLSVEGLRWLFTHSLDDPRRLLSSSLLLLLAFGSVGECGLLADLRADAPLRHRRLAFGTLVGFLLVFVLFLLFLLLPSSPLRGITGTLLPSPFVSGVVPVGAFCVVCLSVVHAYSSSRMGSISRLFHFLARALSRHLLWLFVCLLGLFLYNLICFIR